MDPLAPLNLLALTLVGIALLWLVNSIAQARGGTGEDLLLQVLTVLGWVLCVGGLFGALSVIAGLAAVVPVLLLVVVGAMSWARLRRSEHRALLKILALSSQRDMALHTSARAFASDQGRRGGAAERLATRLESGMPLGAAMRRVRLAASSDVAVAVGVGERLNRLGPFLQQVVDQEEEVEQELHAIVERFFYLALLLIAASGVMLRLSLETFPLLEEVYEEYQTARGFGLAQILALRDHLPVLGTIAAAFHLGLAVLLVLAVLYYAGWSSVNFPWLNRLWQPVDRARLMRVLGGAVKTQHTIPEAMDAISDIYPRRRMQKRLERARARIPQGWHWTDSLKRARAVTALDAAVLHAAERAGNLEWALEEQARGTLRRFALRLRAVYRLVMPCCLILIGLLVLLFAYGVFGTVIDLIRFLL